jgi:hypothetical protein
MHVRILPGDMLDGAGDGELLAGVVAAPAVVGERAAAGEGEAGEGHCEWASGHACLLASVQFVHAPAEIKVPARKLKRS